LLNRLPPGWNQRLAAEADQPYFQDLDAFLTQELAAGAPIQPPQEWILRALQSVDYEAVKVVILGQDPYPGAGHAIGLSFAVPNETHPKPPSLKNIFSEIQSDLGLKLPQGQSDLTGWIDQGVLLLNTVLTVRQGEPFSHHGRGWEQFTDRIISLLDEHERPLVFLLWGAHAQKKAALLKSGRHSLLQAPHPSPLSAHRGFLGCRHFSQANEILRDQLGAQPIDWGRISRSPAGEP
jgi:uracil-DNA glycosylase